MGDLIWFIVIAVIFILLSLIFIWLGFQISQKQKMNLIISYHCDKVSSENKKAYCTLAGTGIFIMGAGFGLSGIITLILQSVFSFVPMTIGLMIGIAMLVWAIKRYNR